MTEWISVEDRLPTYLGKFLVVQKDDLTKPNVHMAIYYPTVKDMPNCIWKSEDAYRWWSIGKIRPISMEITHWMPLPPVPQEEPKWNMSIEPFKGYHPPPWHLTEENAQKTEGWCAHQDWIIKEKEAEHKDQSACMKRPFNE